MPTPDAPQLPPPAIVVATLKAVAGVWALYDTLAPLGSNHINISPAVIFLFTGIGLYHRKELARLIGRLFHIIAALSLPSCLIFILILGPPDSITLNPPDANPWVALPAAILLYALNIWIITVLNRPDVKAACQ